MRTRALVPLLIALLCVFSTADASLYETDESVIIEEGTTIPENVILTGRTVRVYGDVLGDVLTGCRYYSQHGRVFDNVFAACQTADILGRTEDILIFAQTVNISADTTGDIRGAAQTFNIYGYVDGDLMVGAESVYIGPDAVVTGDMYVGAAKVTILGEVLGDVKGGMDQLTIGGTIQGDVEAWCDDFTFIGSGEIKGDLDYHAENEYNFGVSPNVHGQIEFIPRVEDEGEQNPFANFIFGLILLVTALVTAFLLVGVWRRGVEGSSIAMERRPGQTIAVGLLGFAAIPVTAIIAMLLVVTFPLGIMLLAMYPILAYIGWVMFGIWLGKTLLGGLLRRDVSLWLAAPFGVLISGILAYVPWIGWFIAVITTTIGMGMLIMQMIGLRKLRTW